MPAVFTEDREIPFCSVSDDINSCMRWRRDVDPIQFGLAKKCAVTGVRLRVSRLRKLVRAFGIKITNRVYCGAFVRLENFSVCLCDSTGSDNTNYQCHEIRWNLYHIKTRLYTLMNSLWNGDLPSATCSQDNFLNLADGRIRYSERRLRHGQVPSGPLPTETFIIYNN